MTIPTKGGIGTSSHGSGYGGRGANISLRHRTILEFLDEGCRNDVDSIINQFLYARGIPFNLLFSPYWHEMVSTVNDAPKGYKSLGHDKGSTARLDHEKEKITHSLCKMTNSWNEHGVSIVYDGWTHVKGNPLISVLVVSINSAIFL